MDVAGEWYRGVLFRLEGAMPVHSLVTTRIPTYRSSQQDQYTCLPIFRSHTHRLPVSFPRLPPLRGNPADIRTQIAFGGRVGEESLSA